MSKFNINDFSEDKLLDESKKKSDTSSKPKWLEEANPTQNLFYDLVCLEFKKIKKDIKSNKDLSPNQRRILKSSIANKAGKTKGMLSTQKSPEINKLIAKRNDELSRIWQVYGKSNQPRKLTRVELEKKYAKLKQELKNIIRSNLGKQMGVLVKDFESYAKDSLIKQINELKTKFEKEKFKAFEFEAKFQNEKNETIRLSKMIMDSKKEIRNLKKEIMSLKSK